jgi:ornithine cyclodeaminase/alanine dehydrogenase-like protein (mu-crystallin family)
MASANYLTDLRTAATSAVATKCLAGEDARVLGIFGTGRQARAHIQVLPLVRRFERVLVCGNHPAQAREFATQMSQEINRPVESVDAQTCVTQSDVLCTCTTSQLPLFDGNLLRPGTHLNLVGAFQPHAREVDSHTVQRAHVVVDTYDGALAEAGDLLIPTKEGVISRDHIAADLHELLTGKKQGRTTSSEITLFKSVGCGLEDLVTAELLQA